MAVLKVTKESFNSVVNLPGIVIIDCWADWCPPCRAFKPVFEKAAERNPDITFGMIDTQKEVALAAALEITTIPTVMIVRDGIPVYSQPGGMPTKAFDDLIMEVRALDMDKVRAELGQDSDDPDDSDDSDDSDSADPESDSSDSDDRD